MPLQFHLGAGPRWCMWLQIHKFGKQNANIGYWVFHTFHMLLTHVSTRIHIICYNGSTNLNVLGPSNKTPSTCHWIGGKIGQNPHISYVSGKTMNSVSKHPLNQPMVPFSQDANIQHIQQPYHVLVLKAFQQRHLRRQKAQMKLSPFTQKQRNITTKCVGIRWESFKWKIEM